MHCKSGGEKTLKQKGIINTYHCKTNLVQKNLGGNTTRVSAYSQTPQPLHKNHGGGTGKNVQNHLRENIGWILFKTRNFHIFLDIQ